MSFPCQFCFARVDVSMTQCGSCGGAVPSVRRPGQRVGDRFEVLEVIGIGPLGATYRVRDLANGYEAALKTIAEDLCPLAVDRSSFVSKIESIVGRTIAGCAMPLEARDDAESVYVVSPLIDGSTLRAVLAARSATRKPLSHEEALRVMVALAATASALHSATPHGALRPENVMVTPRGLILTDCAVAVQLPADKLQHRIRSYARAVPFVSPEATAGKRVTATSDLYALGAIATELLAGSPTLRALEYAGLPPDIEQALRTMLERDPTKRPGALGALLDGLSASCGFERRPHPAPLPLPEVPERNPRPSRPASGRMSSPAGSGSQPSSSASSGSGHSPSVAAPNSRVVDEPPTYSGRPSSQPRVEASPVKPVETVAIQRDRLQSRPAEVPRAPEGSRPAVPSLAEAVSASASRRAAHGDGVDGPPTMDLRPGLPKMPAGRVAAAASPPVPAAAARPVMPRIPPLPSVGRDLAPRAAPAPSVPKVPKLPGAGPARPGSPVSVDRDRSRELDGIDPRLLRAARKLDKQRGDSEEIDLNDVEVLDD